MGATIEFPVTLNLSMIAKQFSDEAAAYEFLEADPLAQWPYLPALWLG